MKLVIKSRIGVFKYKSSILRLESARATVHTDIIKDISYVDIRNRYPLYIRSLSLIIMLFIRIFLYKKYYEP